MEISKLLDRGVLKRFGMIVVWNFVIYWIVRAPMQMFMTDYLNIWYVTSNFIAGGILLVVGQIFSEFVVWRKKDGA